MILQQLQYHISVFVLSSSTSKSPFLASSRRSVSRGAARKTASKKTGKMRGEEKRFLSPRFSRIFSLAVFRAAPLLTESLEAATQF